jgi:molybdopterin molybdotransferase
MISYNQAIEIIKNSIKPMQTSMVNTRGSHGVLAEDLISASEIPAFSNSAMDGFALNSSETEQATVANPLELDIIGTLYAGDSPPLSNASFSCFEIMTGSIIPEGFDCVIPVEQVTTIERDGKKFLVLDEAISKGKNVRLSGEDFKTGDIILEKGNVIEPHNMMAAIANGIKSVKIFAPPPIGIVVTGSELDNKDGPSIANTNGPYLEASIRRLGLICDRQLHARDDKKEIRECIQQCLDLGSKIIITSGGVSAGKADFVPSVLIEMGAEILFHKVWIRPGKPILMAIFPSGQIVFGLPGNPVSVAVGFRFFVAQTLRLMQGQSLENRTTAINKLEYRKSEKFCFFAKANTSVNSQGVVETTIMSGQESFKLKPFNQTNSWAIIPEGVDVIYADQEIEVVPLNMGENFNP